MLKNHFSVLKHGCTFHTSCTVKATAGKFLRKVMKMDKKKRRYEINETPILPSTSLPGKSGLEAKITGNPRRMNVLNKIFMRHVTDIMATGEYANEILGKGIEVNRVQVSPDYKFLKVYWVARQSDNHDGIESILKKNAGHLRHELSTLRVIGQIPNIVFVKDKTYGRIAELQARLNRADFGEDHTPPDIGEQFKSDFEILTCLDSDLKQKVVKIELDSFNEDDTLADDIHEIPEMPQNVLGLNHADILKRVKKGMSTSRAPHRSADASEWAQWSEFKTTQPINEAPVKFASHNQQRKAFKDFLQQRQILEKKLNKNNKMVERDYIEEELRERHLMSMENDSPVEEEDYILEEDIVENK